MQCNKLPPSEIVAASKESFQDFLIKLDMKPRMHLVEISIFSQNNVTVRLTKIMNNLLEHLKILILIIKILYFLKMCPIFVGSVHSLGRSDSFFL